MKRKNIWGFDYIQNFSYKIFTKSYIMKLYLLALNIIKEFYFILFSEYNSVVWRKSDVIRFMFLHILSLHQILFGKFIMYEKSYARCHTPLILAFLRRYIKQYFLLAIISFLICTFTNKHAITYQFYYITKGGLNCIFV